jgi:membrane protease YdiL (CAAX protease family)
VARTGVHVRMDELIVLCASLAATAVMIRSVDVRPWRDLGLGRSAARAAPVAYGTLIGGAAIGTASALLLVAGWLRIVPALPGSSLSAALHITALLLPAALFEEVVCRGYLLTALRDSIGARGAVACTSVLFGLGHLQNVGATLESVLIVTLAGIFLGAVRVAFDSLYAAWGAHAAWNWVMAVPLHAPVSGLKFEAPDYRTVSAGPEWITGGAWGPEGGLAAALAMVAGLAYLHARHRRDHTMRPGREES